MNLPTKRQQQIVEWLQATPELALEDIAGRLQVSLMTVHRDVDDLAESGLVRKFRGGVALSVHQPDPNTCDLCRGILQSRTLYTVQTRDGQTLNACCPHCGLLLRHSTEVTSALARDFLYGRMVNVLQAGFVIGSRVALCCEPSVLCFANDEDARRFGAGFGGQPMNYALALEAISSGHQSCHP